MNTPKPDHRCDWELVVRVRLRNVISHDENNAEATLREHIKEEGGIYQVLLGWCDDEDFELVSVKPVES